MNINISTIRKAVDFVLAACESPAAPVYALVIHSIFLAVIVTYGLGSVISFSALTLLFRFATIVGAKWVRSANTTGISNVQNLRATVNIDGCRRDVDLNLSYETLEYIRGHGAADKNNHNTNI